MKLQAIKNKLIVKLGGFTKQEVLQITETCSNYKEIDGRSITSYDDIKGLSEGQILYKMKSNSRMSLLNELIPYIKYSMVDKPWDMQKVMVASIKVVEGK